MNWTEIYRDAVSGQDILLVKAAPPEGVVDLAAVKPCIRIPCPMDAEGHDEQCESFWVEGACAWSACACEERAGSGGDR